LFGLGPQELFIILLILLVVFGATQVPKLMRGMGEGIREFRHAVKDTDKADKPAEDQAAKNSPDCK
jgi:sec-independent protein translocase protein TatA